jgi:hypothetical protein
VTTAARPRRIVVEAVPGLHSHHSTAQLPDAESQAVARIGPNTDQSAPNRSSAAKAAVGIASERSLRAALEGSITLTSADAA